MTITLTFPDPTPAMHMDRYIQATLEELAAAWPHVGPLYDQEGNLVGYVSLSLEVSPLELTAATRKGASQCRRI